MNQRNLEAKSGAVTDLVRALRSHDSASQEEKKKLENAKEAEKLENEAESVGAVSGAEKGVVKNELAKVPATPTPEQVQRHLDQGHIPSRNWCPLCVMGKAKELPHLRSKEEAESAVPLM